MSPTAIRYWFKVGATPRDESLLELALVRLNEEVAKKFSTPAQLTGKEQTGVYYNNSTDSASSFDPAALFRSQQVTAWVVSPNSAWSAKSMSTKLFTISAFPGAAGLAIQFTEEFAGFRRGSVFFFRETSYPSDGIILLLESITGDQSYRIGWIDPSISGSDIQSAEGVVNLSEWKLTYYCFAVGWGPGDQVNDGKWSSNGISFR
jgi:hypothetical protein